MALPPFFPGSFMPTLRNNSDTLLAAGTGLLSGNNAQQQVSGLAQGVGAIQKRNRTAQFLRQQGQTDLADAIESGSLEGGEAYKLYYAQKLKDQKDNYLTAGKNIYNTQTGQWVTPPGGAANADNEYGLNVIYGIDPETHETVLGQVGKDGSFHRVDTGGFKPVGSTTQQNLGTTYQTRDRAGNIIGTAPIDIAGKQAQEEIGTSQGKSIAAAPGDLQAGINAKDLITQLKTDPNRQWGTGKSAVFNAIPGTPGYDYQTKVNQAASGAFLTAIQQMRGLGSLSNAEGGAATAAVTRMNTATSEGEFMRALDDYEKIIDQGIARAQQKIQQSNGQVQAPPGVPAPDAPSGAVRVYNPTTGKLE